MVREGQGTTLFLDEIGDLPPELQAKLLRVLQDGAFERVGGTNTIKTDARIIVATNKDLSKELGAGRFQKDLWYRLTVFPIRIPSPVRSNRRYTPLRRCFRRQVLDNSRQELRWGASKDDRGAAGLFVARQCLRNWKTSSRGRSSRTPEAS